MPDDPRDSWRLPSVERFGEQLRDLERSTQGPQESRPRRLAVLASVCAVVLTLVVVALLDTSHPADASSPVKRAPARAVASRSVSFHSVTTVLLGGRLFGGFSQVGVLDFATGEYQTVLSVPSAQVSLETRRVHNVVYSRESHGSSPPGGQGWRAARVGPATHGALASALGSTSITDPVGVLRILKNTRGSVRFLGRTVRAGVPVDHYVVSSNLASVLQAASGAPAPRSYGHIRVAIAVFLDAAGRPIVVTETFSGPTSRGRYTLTSTVTFSAYGTAVQIARPSEARLIASRHALTPPPPVTDPARLFELLAVAKG